MIEGDYAILISLYHGMELLIQHGMKSFFIFLKGIVEGSKGTLNICFIFSLKIHVILYFLFVGNMRSKTILQTNSTFISIYDELISLYGESPNSVVLLTQAGQSQKQSVRIKKVVFLSLQPK